MFKNLNELKKYISSNLKRDRDYIYSLFFLEENDNIITFLNNSNIKDISYSFDNKIFNEGKTDIVELDLDSFFNFKYETNETYLTLKYLKDNNLKFLQEKYLNFTTGNDFNINKNHMRFILPKWLLV